MRRGVKLGLASGGGLLALGLGWGVYLLVLAGELSAVNYHSDATCVRIEGVVGPEDMVFLEVGGDPDGAVLVSSDDRRATVRGEEVRGAILYVSLAADAPPPRDISPSIPEVFHPHGIALAPVNPETGAQRLFVVNHTGDSLFGSTEREGPAHTIEIFDVHSDAGEVGLDHARTISDPMLISPNDVAAVDGERFYVTNDHGLRGHLGRKLEDYAHLARSHVLYFDGERFTVAAEDILYANGIELSPDRRTLYVAAITGDELRIFDRDLQSGALSLRDSVTLRGPDNITIADDGALWIGAHPKLLTFQRYAKDPEASSPSQVFRVVEGEAGWTVEDIFASDGSDISGSSVALARGDRMLIGSVFDTWLLDCDRSP